MGQATSGHLELLLGKAVVNMPPIARPHERRVLHHVLDWRRLGKGKMGSTCRVEINMPSWTIRTRRERERDDSDVIFRRIEGSVWYHLPIGGTPLGVSVVLIAPRAVESPRTPPFGTEASFLRSAWRAASQRQSCQSLFRRALVYTFLTIEAVSFGVRNSGVPRMSSTHRWSKGAGFTIPCFLLSREIDSTLNSQEKQASPHFLALEPPRKKRRFCMTGPNDKTRRTKRLVCSGPGRTARSCGGKSRSCGVFG